MTTADLPDAASVDKALAAINASPEFARAPVMRHLLKYLVEETLAGRGDRVKAYSVAVDALGRNADFDAGVDSYPRVQVGRLRRMLESYDASHPDATLRLRIPLGTYRIDFGRDPSLALPDLPTTADDMGRSSRDRQRWRWIAGSSMAGAGILAAALALVLGREGDTASAPMLVAAPTVAIEAGNPGAAVRAQAQIAEIVRDIGSAIAQSGIAEVRTGGGGIEARYGIVADSDARGREVTLRLIDRTDGRLMWSDSAMLPVGDDVERDDALRPLISALIRPTGYLVSLQLREYRADFRPGYPCLLQYGTYFRSRNVRLRGEVERCIARTIRIDPNHARALAAASFMMFDPAAGRSDRRAIERARTFTRLAALADPSSADVAAAEARVAVLDGRCERGRRFATNAVTRDPFDTDLSALMGLMMVPCDPATASTWLREAFELDPYLPNFYTTAIIALEYKAGNVSEVIRLAAQPRPPGDGTQGHYLLGQILGAIARGDDVRARSMWQALLRITPAPNGTADEVVARYYLIPALRPVLVEALAGAGIARPR